MTKFAALIDANVWYSATLRDIFVEFAYWDFYKPLWTLEIFDETLRNLEKQNVLYAETFKRHRAKIADLFPDGGVVEFQGRLGSLKNVHISDEHVLAAAIIGRADAIVTFNIKDFPSDAFEQHGLEILHPDAFLLDQFFLNPRNGLTAVARLLNDYSNPSLSVQEYCSRLNNASCPGFGALILENESAVTELRLNLG